MINKINLINFSRKNLNFKGLTNGYLPHAYYLEDKFVVSNPTKRLPDKELALLIARANSVKIETPQIISKAKTIKFEAQKQLDKAFSIQMQSKKEYEEAMNIFNEIDCDEFEMQDDDNPNNTFAYRQYVKMPNSAVETVIEHDKNFNCTRKVTKNGDTVEIFKYDDRTKTANLWKFEQESGNLIMFAKDCDISKYSQGIIDADEAYLYNRFFDYPISYNIGFYEDEKTSCADKRIRFATQADNLKYQTGYKRYSKERYKAQEEYEFNWDNELYSYSTNYKKSSDGFIQASEKYIVNSQGKIVEYHQNAQSNWSKAILEFNQGKLQRINKNCSTKLNNITGEQISAQEVVEFDSFEKPILEF